MSEPILPLEPRALELRPDHDGQIRLSIAISLKRIADRLEGITTLFGDGSMGQMNIGCEGNINVSNSY